MPTMWWWFRGWWHIYGENSWGWGADLLITLQVGLSSWKLNHNKPLFLTCLFPVVKLSNWSVKWGIKGRNMGRRDQDILEELFHSESIQVKSTELECKLQPIPEAVENFLAAWRPYPPCQIVWWGNCCVRHPWVKLPAMVEVYDAS